MFWKKVTCAGLDSLFVSIVSTSEKVIEAIIAEETCVKDSKITTWLHRYLRACKNDELMSFLRFVTGASTLPLNTIIKLQFIDQSS